MPRPIRLAIVGDYTPGFLPHAKTDEALEHTRAALGLDVNFDWVSTVGLTQQCPVKLSAYDAVWIAPGSPYRSMAGALNAIRYSRESGLPLLGTCAGCQHVAIEFAHNVLGLTDAGHAESDPYASKLIITPLSCSLKGLAMEVAIGPDSRIAAIYGTSRAIEEYYCNFGLNPEYQDRLHTAGLQIVGKDIAGEARILWLPKHPFFVAALFVPQLLSTPVRPHPLIAAFVRAAQSHHDTAAPSGARIVNARSTIARPISTDVITDSG